MDVNPYKLFVVLTWFIWKHIFHNQIKQLIPVSLGTGENPASAVQLHSYNVYITEQKYTNTVPAHELWFGWVRLEADPDGLAKPVHGIFFIDACNVKSLMR